MDTATQGPIELDPHVWLPDARLPERGMAPRISLEEILLVPKTSKLEQRRETWDCSFSEAIRRLASAGEDVQKLITSHESQQAALQEILRIIPKEQIVPWGLAGLESLRSSKAVISLGGDGQFNFVTQACRDQVIIGMKSDPESYGAMLKFVPDDMDIIVAALAHGAYELETWPRAQAKVGNRILAPATSEYFVGESARLIPSTIEIQWNGEAATVRGSGLIISTGAGSTGFMRSAGRYLGDFARPFSPEEEKLRFLVSEPMEETFARGLLLCGEVHAGDTFKLRPIKANKPVISGDGVGEFDVRGETIEIGFSPSPLKILKGILKG